MGENNKAMKKFTIIIPVRNGGKYFKECLNSALNQRFDDYEIILLDNNSSDGSPEWAESLQDPKITVYRSGKPLYITESWARATQVPKGTYITLLGHDDILHPNYLAVMDALIHKHPEATLYQAHFNYIYANGKLVRPCKPMRDRYSAAEFLQAQLTFNLDSMGTGYMMRSADYDALGGIPTNFPNLIFADYALWMQLAAKGYLAVSSETAFDYRIHQSVSRITNGQDYQKAFFLYLDFLDKQMMGDPELKRVFEKNGNAFMMHFCESLSHRILKTPASKRQVRVADFVSRCTVYANRMMPQQDFNPMQKTRISLAVSLDKNRIGRLLFKVVKQMTLLFSRKV